MIKFISRVFTAVNVDQHKFYNAVDFHMKTIVQSHRRAGLSSQESQKHQSN